MNKTLFLIVLCCITCLMTFAQQKSPQASTKNSREFNKIIRSLKLSDGPELPVAVINDGCNDNLRLLEFFSDSYARSIPKDKRGEYLTALREQIDARFAESYKGITEKYEQKKTEAMYGKAAVYGTQKFLLLTNDIIHSGLEDVGVGKSPMGKIGLKVVKAITEEAIDAGAEAINNKIKEDRQKALDGLLYNLKNQNRESYDALIINPAISKEELINQLFTPNVNNDIFYKSLEDDDQNLFLKHMLEELKENVRDSQLDNLGRDETMSNAIKENSSRVIAVEKEFKKYVQTTNESLGLIVNSQNNIQTKLKELSDRTDLNTKDLEFIKDFMYSKMTPSEKLGVIGRGFLDHLSPQEKEKEELKLQLLIEQEVFINGAKGYLQDAQNLMTIANNLGISGDLLEKAQEGVNILNTGMTAFQQFSSQNYLGAVASITGIFGRPKQDPVISRLIAMNKKLDHILAKQDYMIEQLNQIQSGLNNLIDGQKIIILALSEIDNHISEVHDDLSKKVYNLHKDVLYNREQMNYYMSQRSLFAIKNTLTSTGTNVFFDIERNIVPSFETFRDSLYRTSSSQFIFFENTLTEAIQFHDQKLSDLERFNSIYDLQQEFKSSEFKGDPDPLKSYNSLAINNYLLTKSILKHYLSELKSVQKDGFLMSLYIPTLNMKVLDAKQELEWKGPSTGTESLLIFMQAEFSPKITTEDNNNNNLLEPRYLIEVAYIVLNYFNALYYLNDKLQILNDKEAIEGKNIADAKKKMLQDISKLINISISQQNLLSGESAIPFIYKTLSNGFRYPDSTEQQKVFLLKTKCLSLLESNGLLRYNFIKYYIRQRLKSTKNSLPNYSLALKFPTNELMHYILNSTDSIISGDTTKKHEFRLVFTQDSTKTMVLNYTWKNLVGQIFTFPLPSAGSATEMLTLQEYMDESIYHNNSIAELLKVKQLVTSEIMNIQFLKDLTKKERKQFYRLTLLSSFAHLEENED